MFVGLLKADCQFYHIFVNYYILIAKAYIYFCKRKPDITHFKKVVRHKFEMEENVANKGPKRHFKEKWSIYQKYISKQ